MFKLRFPENKIQYWSDRYSYPSEDLIEESIALSAKKRGYLRKEEFIAICRWKTARSQRLVKANRPESVEAVTRTALESRHENVKIGVLLLLKGISFPTASVILHFCDKQPYPIIDYRALWSLGFEKPPVYTFDFWLEYTGYVRQLARRSKQTMRAVDRALWQYSKEHQQ